MIEYIYTYEAATVPEAIHEATRQRGQLVRDWRFLVSVEFETKDRPARIVILTQGRIHVS